MDREMIWKWLWVGIIQENVASVIDNALWDLAGNYAKLPKRPQVANLDV